MFVVAIAVMGRECIVFHCVVDIMLVEWRCVGGTWLRREWRNEVELATVVVVVVLVVGVPPIAFSAVIADKHVVSDGAQNA